MSKRLSERRGKKRTEEDVYEHLGRRVENDAVEDPEEAYGAAELHPRAVDENAGYSDVVSQVDGRFQRMKNVLEKMKAHLGG